MSQLSASPRTILCSSASLLYAVLAMLPATARCADWTFDYIYGSAITLALPGGQVTLVRDGAGQQARTIIYTPADNAAPIRIERSYGPGGRKAIENEAGVTRHHVYGTGLAPILRTESDGGLTYQVGLETLSVSTSNAVTRAHRVADLKESTVAVLNDLAQAMQRVSYTTYGNMRAESAAVDTYSATALLAGYEGLRGWLLDTDYVVDNRARLYAASAGRFSELDYARQALAYEARGNNPVTHVDPDGNTEFDRLVKAAKEDRLIRFGFGDHHGSIEMSIFLVRFTLQLLNERIPFEIGQEGNLLSQGVGINEPDPRFKNTSFYGYVKFLLQQGLIVNLNDGHTMEMGEDEAGKFHASLLLSLLQKGYKPENKIYRSDFYKWEHRIPRFFENAERKNRVAILFLGALHFTRQEFSYPRYLPVYYGNYYVLVSEGIPILLPLTTFNIRDKYNLVFVTSANDELINKFALESGVFRAIEPRNGGSVLRIEIPYAALKNHRKLVTQYMPELVTHFFNESWLLRSEAKEEKKDGEKSDEEKHNEDNPGQHGLTVSNPLKRPARASFDPSFHEK